MIKEAIAQLIDGKDLSFDMTKEVMGEIMDGNATDAQIASFITALAIKGETIDEITACAQVMRAKGVKLDTSGLDVFEIVGTGGDKVGTFNISTTAAFVIAAAGVPVAFCGSGKKRNRSTFGIQCARPAYKSCRRRVSAYGCI